MLCMDVYQLFVIRGWLCRYSVDILVEQVLLVYSTATRYRPARRSTALHRAAAAPRLCLVLLLWTIPTFRLQYVGPVWCLGGCNLLNLLNWFRRPNTPPPTSFLHTNTAALHAPNATAHGCPHSTPTRLPPIRLPPAPHWRAGHYASAQRACLYSTPLPHWRACDGKLLLLTFAMRSSIWWGVGRQVLPVHAMNVWL